MRKICIVLFLFFLCGSLFTLELSDLEKQIITAEPEEMVTLVHNRGLEKEMNSIFNRLEENAEYSEHEDMIDACMAAFPGNTEEECSIMLLKLLVVSTLGSGIRDNVYNGMEFLEYCMFLNSMIEYMDEADNEEFLVIAASSYWKDLLAFAVLFDSEAFILERFPEDS